MINTKEIERIIETYQYRTESRDMRATVESEFPGSDLEICYALTLINSSKYESYIIDRLDSARIQEIFTSYEQLSLYEKLIPAYFTKYDLLRDKQSNIDLDFFLFEREVIVAPIYEKYSVDAYYNLYLTLKINGNESKFGDFIGIFAYEIFLAKYGEKSKLDDLVIEGFSEEELLDYIKWAKIKYDFANKSKKKDIDSVIFDIENGNNISEKIILENDDIASHKNEIVVKVVNSVFKRNDSFDGYIDFLERNKIDYSEYFKNIFLKLLEQDEDLTISFMILPSTKSAIDLIDKRKIYEILLNKNALNTLIILVGKNVIKINDFIDYYLDVVCKDLPSSNSKVIELSMLKNIQNYYHGNLDLKMNTRMISIISYLKLYPKPENLSLRQEIQDILFTDYYSEIQGENFSNLFPELYKDLLFIEKYNMFADFSDFQQYFKDLNLTKSGKGQNSFLESHITQIFFKLDKISTIISNKLVEWSLEDAPNLDAKNKIVNNMIESINNVNSMLKYILDLMNTQSVNVEDLFNEEYIAKNKFKNLNFIKNSGFGELKINGLFSFDGSNEELADIVEMLNLQAGKVTKSKEIDHYSISKGTPPRVDLFETKNLSRLLTYDEDKYLSDIQKQQEYLNSLIVKFKDKVEFNNHIFVNNGYSVFTEKVLRSFGFFKVYGFCMDFSKDPEDIVFVNVVKRLKSVFSVKNANVIEKTPEFLNFLKMAVLKTLDDKAVEEKVVSVLDKYFLATIDEKNIRNMYNQSFRSKMSEKAHLIRTKYPIG